MHANVLVKLTGGGRRKVLVGLAHRYPPSAAMPAPSRSTTVPRGEEQLPSRETLPQCPAALSEREFHVERCFADGWERVAPVGELDGATTGELECVLADALTAGRPLLIDLSRLNFIDSSGLWTITLAQRSCRRRGIELSLRSGPEHVRKVFEVTGLYDLLPFADTASTL